MSTIITRDAGTVTINLPATGTVYSPSVRVLGSISTSITAVITGTADGVLYLQQSQIDNPVNADFSDVQNTNLAVSGADITHGYNIGQLPSVKYVRVKYVATSGTGTAAVSITVAESNI